MCVEASFCEQLFDAFLQDSSVRALTAPRHWLNPACNLLARKEMPNAHSLVVGNETHPPSSSGKYNTY